LPPNLPHAELATILHFCLTLPSLRVPFLLCPTSNLYLTDFRSLVARPPRQLIQHSGCSCATRHEGNLRFIAPAWRQPRRWRGFSALLFLLFAACQRPRRLPSRTFPPPPPYATEPPARATAGPRHIQYVAFDAVLSVWGKVCVKRKFTSCRCRYVAACCLIPVPLLIVLVSAVCLAPTSIELLSLLHLWDRSECMHAYSWELCVVHVCVLDVVRSCRTHCPIDQPKLV